MAHLTKLTVCEWDSKKHRVMNYSGGPVGDVHNAHDQVPIADRNHPIDGAMWATWNGSTYIPGSGAAGTAPPTALLLKAVGASETVNAGVSVVYTFAGAIASTTPVTIDTYIGNTYKVQTTACVGDATFRFLPGQRAIADWSLNGTYTAPTEAAGSAVIEVAASPEPCKGLACTLNSDTLILKSITIPLNNETDVPNYDLNAVTGVSTPNLIDTNPAMEIVAVMPALATANYYTDLLAETEMAFSMVIGATVGNILTVTADTYLAAVPELIEEGGKLGVRLLLETGWLSTNTKLTFTYT